MACSGAPASALSLRHTHSKTRPAGGRIKIERYKVPSWPVTSSAAPHLSRNHSPSSLICPTRVIPHVSVDCTHIVCVVITLELISASDAPVAWFQSPNAPGNGPTAEGAPFIQQAAQPQSGTGPVGAAWTPPETSSTGK